MSISALAHPTTDWHGYYIEPCPGMDGRDLVDELCDLCGGLDMAPESTRTSTLPRTVCSACDGDFIVTRTVDELRHAARAVAHSRAEHVDAMRRLRKKRMAFDGAHPGLTTTLTRTAHRMHTSDPLRGRLKVLLERINDSVGALTSRQVDEAHAILEQLAHDEASLRPVPLGRTILRGLVTARHLTESAWCVSTAELLLQGAGWRVWGPEPEGVRAISCGDVLELAATVTASDQDRSLGFYTRPTDAHILTASTRLPAA